MSWSKCTHRLQLPESRKKGRRLLRVLKPHENSQHSQHSQLQVALLGVRTSLSLSKISSRGTRGNAWLCTAARATSTCSVHERHACGRKHSDCNK
jgi:hypothetical protein